jgi:glycolate oxidase FAD binding subunit
MDKEMQPTAVSDLQEIVRTGHWLLPRGAGSKPALSTPARSGVEVAVPPTTLVEMSGLSGILEYEPGEYTFTAYAGTAVSHIQRELAKNGQYLPFDPLLVTAGATLGGTVAANSCGSGRYRYGGVRDFILGVKFVDGYGRLIRAGGKVVKNAAGFDLPKFMVGSLGRYGLLVELSFKVFPEPRSYTTLRITYATLEAALAAIFSLANRPFEMDALDVVLEAGCQLFIRLGGLPDALPGRAQRLWQFLEVNSEAVSHKIISDDKDIWQRANDLAWTGDAPLLVKVPVAPKRMVELDTAVAPHTTHRRYTAGGNVAWLAAPEAAPLDVVLTNLGLAGLVFRGTPGQPYLGQQQGLTLAERVKRALDPNNKFGSFVNHTDGRNTDE